MPPFPLLRLPRLVLCEVFKSLNIEEKIKLSICSKKISFQINNDRMYSQKVIVSLDMINQGIRVHSENDEDAFKVFIDLDIRKMNYSKQQFSIACRTVKVMSTRKKFKMYWKNYQEGFLSVIRHLLKMFQCKISTSFDCHGSDIFQPTISTLFDLQLEFKMLNICLKGSMEENLLWNQISSDLRRVEYLTISSVPNPGFTPVITSWPQQISIMNSAWFTLESLLTCTCNIITIGRSDLENKDLDDILNNWKTGAFPNLEYLYIKGKNITNNGTTILGRNLMELDGMIIQTDNGSKKATIKLGFPWAIEIYVTPFE
ncbi:hypothetical protein GCK72_003025 [Caenorhabditis remanei]|uniref:F-box domain-containing protein n=1 Tax=Caenorhabditis remanei TaxID=31234 RepID=A0A6A5HTY7_CAERE|nr:hypothetical protein GCK72_003025 [Caenorhabditis remanei]KAF1771199.1 hypothetical protein GCK72_003025 [Caenorhabditis remanei]